MYKFLHFVGQKYILEGKNLQTCLGRIYHFNNIESSESHEQRSLAGYSPGVTKSQTWLSNEASMHWFMNTVYLSTGLGF